MKSNRINILIFVFCLFAGLTNIFADTINVSSISSLQTAINNSKPGDVIILADGTYLNSTINISANNITVKAATLGGVFFNGSQEINIYGDGNTFSGFQFTSGSITGQVITVFGSHNSITQLNFKGYSAKKYIVLNAGSQYNTISYCNFENKPVTAPSGNLIHIDPSATVPGYHKIRYCSFQNIPGDGGDFGNECIRISNGATSTFISRTVVEYNYFNNTGKGDSESISNKCRENVIRYNTSVNNQDAMFCFRNGDDCVAYGNFFIGAGGIRVKEANNIYCYNNYFENAGVGGKMGAVTYVYHTANTTNVLNNINFIHNTFVDCGNINFDKGASNNTWANNIFKKTSGNIFMGSVTGIEWAGNIYYGSLGISIPSGMTNADPKLIINSAGYYSPSALSTAKDAASATYPAIMDIENIDDDPSISYDIKGLLRPASAILKDVGCEEFNAIGTITNRPLELADVGPTYLMPITTITNPIKNTFYFNISSCPASGNLTVNYNLENNSLISIDIYDLTGNHCKSLVQNIRKLEGNHYKTFDISSLKSGVYLVRLTADSYSKSIKILVNE